MFKKAERKLAKLRLGMCGPSGTGKTWSALEIATGMGGKIALLDTERRGHLYAEDFQYDICELDAPYSPMRYIEKIREAEKAGYDILIIDSLSHAWCGEGGVLSIADRAGTSSSFQGWKTATPQQNLLTDSIITSKLHIISTLRTKTDYVVEPNEKGKMAPRKVGLAPIQKDGLEYEFTLFMDLNQEHFAHITKDNTKLFDQQFIKPTKEMGEKLMEWLNQGIDESEIFKQDLSFIEREIKSTETMNELKDKYQQLWGRFPKLQTKLVEFKEERKNQIMGAA